jgi:hypothetical protein
MKEKQMANRKMKIYGLGGAGTNIVQRFLKKDNDLQAGSCEIDVVFVDTSRSNLGPMIPNDKVYLLDGLDGSGKVRASNYGAIVDCSKEILMKHKPADINVVVTSGSGGSGSVIGPVLVSELLSRGEEVIVITVGGTASRIETENTLKTLKSYEAISEKRNAPVILSYFENSAATPRSKVDDDAQLMIMMISVFFSGQNRELDGSDLRNFLNYQNVTSYKPKLSYLSFSSGGVSVGKGQAIVSLVTLADEGNSTEIDAHCEYQAVGYIPEGLRRTMAGDLPIHGAVITGYFNSVVDSLVTKIANYDEARSAVVEKSITNSSDKATDNGVIL